MALLSSFSATSTMLSGFLAALGTNTAKANKKENSKDDAAYLGMFTMLAMFAVFSIMFFTPVHVHAHLHAHITITVSIISIIIPVILVIIFRIFLR